MKNLSLLVVIFCSTFNLSYAQKYVNQTDLYALNNITEVKEYATSLRNGIKDPVNYNKKKFINKKCYVTKVISAPDKKRGKFTLYRLLGDTLLVGEAYHFKHDQLIDYSIEYEYDANNNLIKKIRYKDSGQIKTSETYTYTEEPLRIKQRIKEDLFFDSKEVFDYIYVDDQLVSIDCVTTTNYVGEGSPEMKTSVYTKTQKFDYNDFGNRLKESKFDHKGVRTLSITYIYDNEGRISKVITGDRNYTSSITKEVLHYNMQGLLSSFEHYENDELRMILEYKYIIQ